jgi:acylpyruvate hydrolase
VVIGKEGKFIQESDAMDHVLGYVLALDMTSRLDMQEYSILLIKGFDTSCPIGPFISKSLINDPDNLDLKLSVNGTVRQHGNTRDLIHKIPFLISYLSQFFSLEYGDLILTGTPSGIKIVFF